MNILRVYAEIEQVRRKRESEGLYDDTEVNLSLDQLQVMAAYIVSWILTKVRKDEGHIRVGKVWYTAEEYRKKFGAGSPAENKD